MLSVYLANTRHLLIFVLFRIALPKPSSPKILTKRYPYWSACRIESVMHVSALYVSKKKCAKGKNSFFQCSGNIFSLFIPKVQLMQFFFPLVEENLPVATYLYKYNFKKCLQCHVWVTNRIFPP